MTSADPSASRYLESLAAATRRNLDDSLTGVYAHGSLALGGWRADRSDIDVLVVVDRPLTSVQQSQLADAWSENSLPCPGIGLELSVVTRDAVARPSARPPFELHMTTAAPDRKVVDGHGHRGDPDLVLHFAVCRASGIAVVGPPPVDLFAHVPHALVVTQLGEELTWAVDHASSAYGVLNACRAWRYAFDGAMVSKLDGGHWAQERLSEPERTLVRAAMAVQTGQESAALDPSTARAFTQRIRDAIGTEAPS